MRFASKKPFYASAAFAFGAFSSVAAWAEPMQFTVGGYFTQSLQLVDIDDHNDGTSFEDEVLAQNAEIHFKGKTMLENGTELGFQVQLEAEQADDQIDEHYLYLRGNWGRLTLGAENGIGHLMQVRAPQFIPGLKIYDNSLTDDVFETAFDQHIADDAIEDAHMSTKLEHISGDANKLSYATPRVGGLQLGVSFTPNNAERGGSANNAADSHPNNQAGDPKQEDIIELGVSYKGTARGVGYKLSYTSVDGDSTAGGDNAVDPKSSSTGFALTYGDWSFGGNLSEYEHLAAVDEVKYADSETIETSNFGLKYRLNKASHIGLGMTESEESQAGNAPKTEYEETTIGGGTKLRDGVQVGYYHTMSEASQAGQAANDAEVSALGMTLALKF